MKYIKFSKHASERLSDRMSGIVTKREIIAAVRQANGLGIGEIAVKVKRLSQVVEIIGSDNSISYGDIVVVVYRRDNKSDPGCVTTVELRGHWQQDSSRWTRVVDLTNRVSML